MISFFFLKYNINSTFKRIALYLSLALKTIISVSTLAFIFLKSTFGGEFSYSALGLLTKYITNVMYEALNTKYLLLLHLLRYQEYFTLLTLLLKDILFASAPDFFPIALDRNCFINLFINNFTNICLDREINSLYKA